jgi:hypothetical protein
MLLYVGLSCRAACVFGLSDAQLKVEDADKELRNAFSAVLEAEGAGANVSDLLFKLNAACGLLSEASKALSMGDADEAVGKAEECMSIAKEVRDEAFIQKQSALADSQKALWTNLALSSIGSLVFLVAIFFVWQRFKRSYVKRLMKMKPEVSSDVEA